jgi:hypothetical protein
MHVCANVCAQSKYLTPRRKLSFNTVVIALVNGAGFVGAQFQAAIAFPLISPPPPPPPSYLFIHLFIKLYGESEKFEPETIYI